MVGVLSYLSPLGWALALLFHLMNRSEYGSFHLRQSLGIGLTLLGLFFLSSIPYFGSLLWFPGIIFCFFFWVVGFMGAVQHKRNMVPYLGPYYQQWLGFL
jgi:uncharacterized membrane protein